MILIIQNGLKSTHIISYLTEEVTIIKSFEYDISTIELEKYQGIIILGGHQSILEMAKYPYLAQLITLINQCQVAQKPVLGICLGCQLIAYARGYEIRKMPDPKIGFGYIINGYSAIFRCHQDYIIATPPLEVLAVVDDMPYIIKDKTMIGVQCHPDITPDTLREYTDDETIINWGLGNQEQINENNRKLITYLLKEIGLSK